MRKICVVSSGRADYGLLYWPMREIQQVPDFELQTIVTGMHLLPEYGMTANLFSDDGFPVTTCVDIPLSGDSSVSVARSLGLAVIGFAEAYEQLEPDMVMLPGDRFEMLAAAQAALIIGIPVAHLFGGDTTEGAFDESIRHSITKMSHLHFVSNELSARRVMQMGENPEHVYVVGSSGLDLIRMASLLERDEFFEAIGFRARKKNLLITFHPVTLGLTSSRDAFRELLAGLDLLGDDIGLIFTRPNADTAGKALNAMLEEYIETHPNAKAYDALGQHYLSALKHVDAVVGNSSSGIYEAPSFGVPTVNIGDRQKGRLQATSVINCGSARNEIVHAIQRTLVEDFSTTVNPYGDGYASGRIVTAIREVADLPSLLQKHFFIQENV